MHSDALPDVATESNSGELRNFFHNPTYASVSQGNFREENRHLNREAEPDTLSHREFIRNSIQIPVARRRRRSRFSCKLLDKDHSEERLFIAYIFLMTLFALTLGSAAVAMVIHVVPLNFFPDCWKLAVALAFLTFAIGAYICWEEGICFAPRSRPEPIEIDIELQTFEVNL